MPREDEPYLSEEFYHDDEQPAVNEKPRKRDRADVQKPTTVIGVTFVAVVMLCLSALVVAASAAAILWLLGRL